MAFINDDFLLQTAAARRLYHEYAESRPILDYHNHLSPREIAQNRRYNNLSELWFGDDHYKWRALRAHGVEEKLITGNAPPYEKFQVWAQAMPSFLGNPIYHWVHLELARYFGIYELLSPATAASIWERANATLLEPQMRVHGILASWKVAALCTTDDPADSLSFHQEIAASELLTRVYPTFRPDKAFVVDQPALLNAWLQKLSATTGIEINTLQDMLAALEQRHNAFHAIGARLSDHSLPQAPHHFATEAEAAAIFANALNGQVATTEEYERFTGFLMLFLARLDTEKGWTKQMHIGALRNNNRRRFKELGPDSGFDSMGDKSQAQTLSRFLDTLDSANVLPQMVFYNLNPADNYVFATMLGNFQTPGRPSKVQWGSGWWFLDQKDGMEWQLKALGNNGLLCHFIGMLTDSRSFMSFPRHEYFRRVLCNLLGNEMTAGELPDDFDLVGNMVGNICYNNAQNYLGLTVGNFD